MSNVDTFTFLPLLAGAIYTVLLLIPLIRRGQQETQVRRFSGFLILSVIWSLSLLLLGRDQAFARYLPDRLLLASTLLLLLTTTAYVEWPHKYRWLLLGGLAIVAGTLVDLIAPNWFIILLPASGRGIPNSQLITLLTWLALSGAIIAQTRKSYRNARFPWHANRQLFWLVAVSTLFLGELIIFLGAFSPLVLPPIGQTIRLTATAGLTYAVISHRIVDVRTRAQRLLATFMVTTISALPVLGAVLLVEYLTRAQSFATAAVLTIAAVSLSFFLYMPFRRLITRIINRHLFGEALNTSQVVRSYSQAISRTLDVQALSLAISGMLNELLGTSRAALMLVSHNEESVQIDPIPALGWLPRQPITFSANSLFVKTITQQHQPLLQYEIDFNPEYAGIGEKEREWLSEIAMEVYVPVMASGVLDGLIAVGPKSDGVPYQPGELDLMQTLADQTVVALQNARLYNELGTQNEQIGKLNVDLLNQNERLEIMDRVKTDFITIASHELRTPLTQVKGYTDILSAINDEDGLSPDQTKEIVSHINRATLRLEGLITAMLDASQLDVEGLHLSYVETRLETVVKLAVEPLQQATRERRITISQTGIEELPTFHADFKRLVQCFANLMGNAVKYTPDHGRITIDAQLVPNKNDELDHIEVTIADTGIGINPEYHDLIFEKFFRIGDPQLHSTGSTKFKGAGPGLGLPIAKGVIEAHGGKIWVESIGEDEEQFPGSSFHILLPLRPLGQGSAQTNGQPADRPAYLIG